MWKRRAAATTEWCREASRLRKVETSHPIFTRNPAECLRQDICVCGEGAFSCLPATGAMASHKFEERQIGLKFNRSTEARTTYRHDSRSPATLRRRSYGNLDICTKRGHGSEPLSRTSPHGVSTATIMKAPNRAHRPRRVWLSGGPSPALLDHFIGGRQQRFRDGEAERLGGVARLAGGGGAHACAKQVRKRLMWCMIRVPGA
jgi:hypothetical protein